MYGALENMLLYVILISTLAFNEIESTLTFRFLPTTRVSNTEETSNYWDCVNGPRVIDNENEPVAVYLDDIWKINEEIRLPKTTEIIFGDNSVIYDKDEDEITCEEKEQTEPSVQYWHDPDNWDIIEDNTTNIVRFLHAEKIPNENEVALFVPDATYFVTLNIPFRVGSIYVADKPHSTASFLAHMSSDEGSLQFKSGENLVIEDALDPLAYFNDPVTITETECQDKTGCMNSNLVKRIRLEICSHVSCPADYPCRLKFQPVGHCCNLCGSMISFKVDETFLFEKLTALQIYIVNKYSQTWMSVLKTTTDSIQIVLVNSNLNTFDSANLEPAIREIVNGVTNDLPGILKESVTVLTSENFSNVDTVALILTLLCLLLIFVGVTVIILKRRTTLLKYIYLHQFWGLHVSYHACWVTTERLSMRAWWHGKEDDEMVMELTEPSTSSIRGKLAARSKPTRFKELLDKEKIESVMGIKSNKEQTLTYPNPVFDTTYEEVD